MKWEKAIKQIKFGLNNSYDVEIVYHRKYYTRWVYYGYVECVRDNEYNPIVVHSQYGEDFINGTTHIIESVRVVDMEKE